MPRTVRTPPTCEIASEKRVATHHSKRLLVEISPESSPIASNRKSVGSLDVSELIKLMHGLLDEKLQDIATKGDISAVTSKVEELSVQVNTLEEENKALKEEIKKIKSENANERKEFQRFIDESRRKNLIFRGLTKNTVPLTCITNLCRERFGIEASSICNARVLYEKDSKMAVKVEFSSETTVKEVFKNIRKLAGSNVTVDNDLSSEKRIEKQVFMELKRSLLSVNQRQKIQVLGSKMKIGDKWFRWDNDKKLMSGKENGVKVLSDLYHNNLGATVTDFHMILTKINTKKPKN